MFELSCADLQAICRQVFPPLVQSLELEVTSANGGVVEVRMPITKYTARPDGVMSGQALCSLADTAMVLALTSAIGEFRPIATVDLRVTFMGAVRDTDAIATATVERVGASLAFVSMVVTSQEGRVAVRASATFAMPRESGAKEKAA
ncbi:PaaI family thioesterase [Cupriavidus basilensis]|uniref:PaaI family thioesterase n=1 Tax=Cupriavidus basilensis TaxID=68895 RepID=A0A7M2HC11_9BURK|nr:PaaI family thioesterase [Cupriavidus basilensis]QOT81939.1 PaaI family thioesterase [Cupriavidus basilensis]